MGMDFRESQGWGGRGREEGYDTQDLPNCSGIREEAGNHFPCTCICSLKLINKLQIKVLINQLQTTFLLHFT